MSSIHPRSRRLGAAVLSGVLAFAGLALTAAPASATVTFDLDRLAGADRFATANRIAVETFTEGAPTVLLAVWDDYADALAGNYLAGDLAAPILLSQTDVVSEATLQTLQTLDADNVTLLGGTAALSEAVVEQLENEGYLVDREFGDDRYETAAAVAGAVPAAEIGQVAGDRTALLATGENFPDAVAGGPVSYAGRFPILLTPKSSLISATSTALTELGIDRVYILGGTAAVSQAVEDQVETKGITTARLFGDDRFETAAAIAQFGIDELGFSTSHINIATGSKFPDAITGGPHAGAEEAGIILSGSVPAATCEKLEALEGTLTSGHIFGGTGVVSAADENDLEQCGGAPADAEAGDYAGSGVEDVKDGISAFTADPGAASDGPDAEDRQFAYDSGDTFQLAGEAITLAQFEGLLTGHVADGANGDVIDITYAPGGTSTFDVTTDNVPAPTDVTAAIDPDDEAGDDVIISWSASDQEDVTYTVVRDASSVLGSDTVIAEDTTATTVTAADQPDGVHTYSVTATSTTSEETSEAATSNPVTVPAGPAPSGGPQAENVVKTNSDDSDPRANAGDVWRIAFSSALAGIEVGDTITLTNSNGQRVTITHAPDGTDNGDAFFQLSGGNVNGVSYGANQVLTVTLRAPAEDEDGSPLVGYPLTVQISTGLTDSIGRPVDWTSSYDRTVESDATPPTATTTLADDADSDGKLSDGDTITVRFGEAMNPDTAEPVVEQITISEGGANVTLTAGTNATFTYSTPAPSSGGLNPPANSLLTISDITTGDTAIDYGTGATVTGARYVTDTAGHNWNLASGDVTVNVSDTVAPEMASARGDLNGTGPDRITVTYSERVRCTNTAAAAAQFTYTVNGNDFKPTGIACNDTATVLLTFADGVYQPTSTTDTLNYAEAGSALQDSPDRIEDLSGNEAVSPQSVPVSAT